MPEVGRGGFEAGVWRRRRKSAGEEAKAWSLELKEERVWSRIFMPWWIDPADILGVVEMGSGEESEVVIDRGVRCFFDNDSLARGINRQFMPGSLCLSGGPAFYTLSSSFK